MLTIILSINATFNMKERLCENILTSQISQTDTLHHKTNYLAQHRTQNQLNKGSYFEHVL